MSGDGLEFSGGVMTVKKGGRTVMGSDRRHVIMFPSSYDWAGTIGFTFPDFTKDWLYEWSWGVRNTGGASYARANAGESWITAIPQEWSQTSVLVAAPAGANFAQIFMNLSRPTAPANQWSGETIACRTDLGEQVIFIGSALLEAQPNMARAMSIIIDPATQNLVLFQQQSVGPPPSSIQGFFGQGPIGTNGATVNGAIGLSADGGEVCFGSVGGFPIYQDASMQGATSNTYSAPSPSDPVPILQGRRRNPAVFVGAGALPITDVTNYKSVYSADLRVAFGYASA